MTEDEKNERLADLAEQYWLAFSALVEETLELVEPELRPELKERLQEKSSVYGRK